MSFVTRPFPSREERCPEAASPQKESGQFLFPDPQLDPTTLHILYRGLRPQPPVRLSQGDRGPHYRQEKGRK